MSRFAKPTILGLKTLDKVPSFSYFVGHPSGKRILFDLEVRKDWDNLSPVVADRMREAGWTAEVKKDVPEDFEENNIVLEGINSVVLSHWHWDHVGDMSKFPPSTSVITRPGFTKTFVLDFFRILESQSWSLTTWDEMTVKITDFPLDINGHPAHDLFGDCSLYLLYTAGHAVGHLSALARITSRFSDVYVGDTFIMLGGDCCHHMAQIGPCNRYPLPYDVNFRFHATLERYLYDKRDTTGSIESITHHQGRDVPLMRLQKAKQLEQEPSLNGFLILLHWGRYDIPESHVTVLGCTLWSKVPDAARDIVSTKIQDFKKIED
ncbi:conserved hypothetical protein [Talaromyces stipitatus ATCC 10500]|uniref:Metallo-beta-lactamase domain-containing protein n=1 Tax=Talaromyces stipitatus (strain ATCC 10500 / CBS 375.48 / QM 6759 / NRRL 1006) TaxID=441959 RepID=B8M190_TALSN|nr:uncharacterized protein TSTA_082650 [Talaromyces stipitatus ATCC 10500]EED21032.1 conserved hypothetical protein [Talaromyces stipitatus ATCC 10500]